MAFYKYEINILHNQKRSWNLPTFVHEVSISIAKRKRRARKLSLCQGERRLVIEIIDIYYFYAFDAICGLQSSIVFCDKNIDIDLEMFSLTTY